MAKAPAARRRPRVDNDAMAKSVLVLLGLVLLAAACTGQHGGRAATATSSWEDTAGPSWDNAGRDGDDDSLEQRQEAMKEAVKVFSNYNQEASDPRALRRAVATMNGEMAALQPTFKAVSRMPEGSAKEEARAKAHELLARHFGKLFPGGSVKVTAGM